MLALKLPRWQLAVMLGKPLTVDLAASALAYILHFGTFTGVMAAAVAGLMVSAMTTFGRELIGYTVKRNGVWEYTPGTFNIFEDKDQDEDNK